MARINLLKALEQVEEERVPSGEVRCNRGLLLSRFNKHGIETPSDYWAFKYFEAGGLVDINNYWGYDPLSLAQFEAQGVDPVALGKVVATRGRVDYEFEEIVQMAKLGLEPRDNAEFQRNVRGIQRKEKLAKLGIPSNRGVISLGYMSKQKYFDFVAKRLEKPSKYSIMFFSRSKGCVDIFPTASIFSPGMRKTAKDFYKYANREAMPKQRVRPYVFARKKTLIYAIIKNLYHFGGGECKDYRAVYTDEGQVKYGQYDGFDLSEEGLLIFQGKALQARRVGGVWVLKINKTWFGWRNTFQYHMEGRTLRETLEKLEKRKKKDTLILCLNDVRNDRTGTAGFCLAGVKSFAADRMKFLFDLIKNYESWAEIPVEIMETEFHLADRQIFNNYPSPV